MQPTSKELRVAKARATKWAEEVARAISPSTRGEMLDQWVWGSFDWMDWFDDKPTKIQLNALYTRLQYLEEVSD